MRSAISTRSFSSTLTWIATQGSVRKGEKEDANKRKRADLVLALIEPCLKRENRAQGAAQDVGRRVDKDGSRMAVKAIVRDGSEGGCDEP